MCIAWLHFIQLCPKTIKLMVKFHLKPPTMTQISWMFIQFISNNQMVAFYLRYFETVFFFEQFKQIEVWLIRMKSYNINNENRKRKTATISSMWMKREQNKTKQIRCSPNRRSKQKVNLNSLSLVIRLRYPLHVLSVLQQFVLYVILAKIFVCFKKLKFTAKDSDLFSSFTSYFFQCATFLFSNDIFCFFLRFFYVGKTIRRIFKFNKSERSKVNVYWKISSGNRLIWIFFKFSVNSVNLTHNSQYILRP